MNFSEKADKLLADINHKKNNRHAPPLGYDQKDFLKDLRQGEYLRPACWVKNNKLPKLNQQEVMQCLFSQQFNTNGFVQRFDPWLDLLKELTARNIIDLNLLSPIEKAPYWLPAFAEKDTPKIWLNLVKVGANPLLRWEDDKKQEYTLWRAFGEDFRKVWFTDVVVPAELIEHYERQVELLPPDQFVDNLFCRNGSVFSELVGGHFDKVNKSENMGFVLVKNILEHLLSYAPINTWPAGASDIVQQSSLESKRPAEFLSFWIDHGVTINPTILGALRPSKEKSALIEKVLLKGAGQEMSKSNKVKI